MSQYLSHLSSLRSQQFPVPFVSDGDHLALQTAMYAATIHLHREDLEVHPQSYQRCLWAANAMTGLVRQLRDNDYDTLCPIISVSPSACCGELPTAWVEAKSSAARRSTFRSEPTRS